MTGSAVLAAGGLLALCRVEQGSVALVRDSPLSDNPVECNLQGKAQRAYETRPLPSDRTLNFSARPLRTRRLPFHPQHEYGHS